MERAQELQREGMWSGTATMENRMEVSQKLKNSTSAYFSEENKNTKLKTYMHPYLHCSIIYKGQDMKAT